MPRSISHIIDILRNQNVPGATIVTNLTGVVYSIQDLGTGSCSIPVNTTGFTLGTHPYSILVSKSYYQSQGFVGIITVNRT